MRCGIATTRSRALRSWDSSKRPVLGSSYEKDNHGSDARPWTSARPATRAAPRTAALPRPRGGDVKGLALALGGGGARAFAHVGVLEVLHREKIPVVAIAGTRRV